MRAVLDKFRHAVEPIIFWNMSGLDQFRDDSEPIDPMVYARVGQLSSVGGAYQPLWDTLGLDKFRHDLEPIDLMGTPDLDVPSRGGAYQH